MEQVIPNHAFNELDLSTEASPETVIAKDLVKKALMVGPVLILVFGLIFLNNDFVPPPISFVDTKLLTRGVMLFVAVVPASYWLLIY